MRVAALEALSFRNLARVLFEPHPRFNVVSGDNGQGKTNLLEALYLVGALRSFRAARLDELIAFGAHEARVRARVERKGVVRRLDVRVTPGHRIAQLDGKSARPPVYFESARVVLFQPEDLRLPRGAPAGRRRFLDRAVFGEQPAYLAEAQAYERVLRSRNAVLRGAGPIDPAQLEVYDEQLARAAIAIIARRRDLTEALAPRAAEVFDRLSAGGPRLEIVYRPSLADRGAGLEGPREIEHAMREQLTADRRRDHARGATSAGPHTDDLELTIGDRSAQKYASQGQLRSIVLALKIAEIQHVTDRSGEPPLLLLDDVSSELDGKRNAQLFEFLGEVSGQVVITTTHPDHIRLRGGDRADFTVQGGVISPGSAP